MLLLVLVLSFPLAWIGRQYHEGRRADALLGEMGGTAICDWHWGFTWGKLIGASLEGANISDSDLERLSQFRSLFWINLQKTPITDRGLSHLKNLPNLHEIFLSDTGITDAGLIDLAEVPNLNFLQAHRTRIAASGVANLQRKLPHLDVYYTAK